jgi:hypothetical protein
MVYANIERRREASRRRYWQAKGVSLPESNGNNGSALESLPSPHRIPEFQPAGRQRTLAKTENWFRNHSSTLTGVLVPVSIGVTIGFFGAAFGYKYLAELAPKAKAFLSANMPRSNSQPEPKRDPMQDLLDFGQDVINRSSTL